MRSKLFHHRQRLQAPVAESVALPPVQGVAALNSPGKPNERVPLKLVEAPGIGHVLSAPPALSASSHTIDYTGGQRGVVLLHADRG